MLNMESDEWIERLTKIKAPITLAITISPPKKANDNHTAESKVLIGVACKNQTHLKPSLLGGTVNDLLTLIPQALRQFATAYEEANRRSQNNKAGGKVVPATQPKNDERSEPSNALTGHPIDDATEIPEEEDAIDTPDPDVCVSEVGDEASASNRPATKAGSPSAPIPQPSKETAGKSSGTALPAAKANAARLTLFD